MHVKGKKHPSHFGEGSSEAIPDILLASSTKAILHFTLSGGMSNFRHTAVRDQDNTE